MGVKVRPPYRAALATRKPEILYGNHPTVFHSVGTLRGQMKECSLPYAIVSFMLLYAAERLGYLPYLLIFILIWAAIRLMSIIFWNRHSMKTIIYANRMFIAFSFAAVYMVQKSDSDTAKGKTVNPIKFLDIIDSIVDETQDTVTQPDLPQCFKLTRKLKAAYRHGDELRRFQNEDNRG